MEVVTDCDLLCLCIDYHKYLLKVFLVQFSGKLLIADTSNSVIRYLDLNKKEPELLTLELKGVQPPAPQLLLMVVCPMKATSVLNFLCLRSTISQRYRWFVSLKASTFSFAFDLIILCFMTTNAGLLNLKTLWLLIPWMEILVQKDQQDFTLGDSLH